MLLNTLCAVGCIGLVQNSLRKNEKALSAFWPRLSIRPLSVDYVLLPQFQRDQLARNSSFLKEILLSRLILKPTLKIMKDSKLNRVALSCHFPRTL